MFFIYYDMFSDRINRSQAQQIRFIKNTLQTNQLNNDVTETCSQFQRVFLHS